MALQALYVALQALYVALPSLYVVVGGWWISEFFRLTLLGSTMDLVVFYPKLVSGGKSGF